MKTLKIFLLAALALMLVNSAGAQSLNWANLNEENKHIITAKFGLEYGAIYEIGYGYQFKTYIFPTTANIDFSFPSGDLDFGDFKTKLSANIRWFEYHNFQVSAKVNGVFRRYENDFVRLLNFGCDLSAAVGYYSAGWFAAAEVGFDKAIVTHFKHSDAYFNQYAGARDGWYLPPTGGNFYTGLQAGVSFEHHDVYLSAGKVLAQDFKTSPMIPLYGKVGYNLKF